MFTKEMNRKRIKTSATFAKITIKNRYLKEIMVARPFTTKSHKIGQKQHFLVTMTSLDRRQGDLHHLMNYPITFDGVYIFQQKKTNV